MLSREDNQLLTDTNPGSPMGELFRRFWLPVIMSEELPAADCVPARVKVMGEDLIAFRDTDGKVGIIDAYCPHRGAAMFFGRNEHNGLRCIYHGWKFDVNGECVDMPNCPEGDTYRNKIHIRHYPTIECGRLIWAYMGPVEKQPPFPQWQFANLPDQNVFVSKFIVECNWAQSLDGAWDPSHAYFLHAGLGAGGNSDPETLWETGNNMLGRRRRGDLSQNLVGPVPDFTKSLPPEKSHTPNGNYMTRVAELPDGRFRASTIPWHLPMFDGFGASPVPNIWGSNIRIPIDNKSIYWYRYRWSPEPISEDVLFTFKHDTWSYPALIPGTFRTVANIHNDYMQDRVVQKQFTYTGIPCFPLQDISVSENQWGPIADRTQEHLCSADYMNIYWRRRLIRSAKLLATGVEPTEPFHPEDYRNHNETAVAATYDEAVRLAHEKSHAWIVGTAPVPVEVTVS